MADYYTQLVCHQMVPRALLTELEYELLTAILDSEDQEDGTIYFYSEDGLNTLYLEDRPELKDLAGKDGSDLAVKLLGLAEKGLYGIDSSDLDYTEIFQGVIRRHPDKLPYLTFEAAHTCSRMRLDGFGGHAVIVTANKVYDINTSVWLDEKLKNLKALGELPTG